MATLQSDLARAKQEYDNQQSERTRIAYVFPFRSLSHILRNHPSLGFYRHQEAETSERLMEVSQKLLQAGIDRSQSEKEAKLKETLTNLQRMFPGGCIQAVHLYTLSND